MEPGKVESQCSRYAIAMKTQNGNTVRYKAFPLRCKSWDCPECSKVKADQYKERIKALFDGRQLYFYTFTYYHSATPQDVWSNYATAWNRFRTAATKRWGSFAYVRVLEHHKKSPYPHLHVIADRHLPADWMAKELQRAGFGYQACQRPVTGAQAATYITKYLTKGWTCEQSKIYRKTLRLRVVSFGGFPVVSRASGCKWQLVKLATGCREALDAIAGDVDWTYGRTAVLTNEREDYASFEYTYVIAGGEGADGILPALLPVSASP